MGEEAHQQAKTTPIKDSRHATLTVVVPPRRDFRFGCGTELNCNQFGELGRDICHRIFCCVQAASRAEQRTDFA